MVRQPQAPSGMVSGPAKVVSVNVGVPRTVKNRGRVVTTAIWKRPVSGRVAVRGVNLAGDDQADRSVHGGVDKAVYVYAREDYEWWGGALGTETLAAGTFGENLTVSGLDLNAAEVGERWRGGAGPPRGGRPRLSFFYLRFPVGGPQV